MSCWTRRRRRRLGPGKRAAAIAAAQRQGILGKFCVTAVCTTDDPTDRSTYHERLRASGLPTKVYPTFRPDASMDPHQPDVFNAWVDKLGQTADVHIAKLGDLLDALRRRHQAFHDIG